MWMHDGGFHVAYGCCIRHCPHRLVNRNRGDAIMKYRGQECNPRPFSDATGTGTEWLTPDGFVASREHATRVVSKEEKDAKEAADAAAAAKAAEVAAEKAALQKVVDDLKAGKITFGDSKRDEAMLAIVKVQARAASAVAVAVADVAKEEPKVVKVVGK